MTGWGGRRDKKGVAKSVAICPFVLSWRTSIRQIALPHQVPFLSLSSSAALGLGLLLAVFFLSFF
jgi:hypothetical protein